MSALNQLTLCLAFHNDLLRRICRGIFRYSGQLHLHRIEYRDNTRSAPILQVALISERLAQCLHGYAHIAQGQGSRITGSISRSQHEPTNLLDTGHLEPQRHGAARLEGCVIFGICADIVDRLLPDHITLVPIIDYHSHSTGGVLRYRRNILYIRNRKANSHLAHIAGTVFQCIGSLHHLIASACCKGDTVSKAEIPGATFLAAGQAGFIDRRRCRCNAHTIPRAVSGSANLDACDFLYIGLIKRQIDHLARTQLRPILIGQIDKLGLIFLSGNVVCCGITNRYRHIIRFCCQVEICQIICKRQGYHLLKLRWIRIGLRRFADTACSRIKPGEVDIVGVHNNTGTHLLNHRIIKGYRPRGIEILEIGAKPQFVQGVYAGRGYILYIEHTSTIAFAQGHCCRGAAEAAVYPAILRRCSHNSALKGRYAFTIRSVYVDIQSIVCRARQPGCHRRNLSICGIRPINLILREFDIQYLHLIHRQVYTIPTAVCVCAAA